MKKRIIQSLLYISIFYTSLCNVYAEQYIEVYVVQQELHTGIVIRQAEVDPEIWPEIRDFKNFQWVDVGWGDFDFYQAPDNDPYLALKAIAMPTASVLRVDGFQISPERYYGNYKKLKFCFTPEQFEKLCRAIASAYKRDEKGNVLVSESEYGLRFYKAKGKYHLMNTCNTWVAEMFRKSGIKNRVAGIITAGQLFSSLDKFSCNY
jgi:uncharacterized protein (TIGR02117 family)